MRSYSSSFVTLELVKYTYNHNKTLTDYSRQNRKKQTDAEKLLWKHLRNKQLLGFKFRRQYPIDNYILDFYCTDKKIAIELDGSQHMQQEGYDRKRTNNLQKKGIDIRLVPK